jgi:hypothetical protein
MPSSLKVIAGTEHRRYLEEVYHNLIETNLALGDISAAERYYEDATPLRKLNPGRTAPRFDFLRGRLLTEGNPPDYSRADELFLGSIDADESSGALVPAAQTRFHRAGLLACMGDVQSGRKLLLEIEKQFQIWDMPTWQMKCEKVLKSLPHGDG